MNRTSFIGVYIVLGLPAISATVAMALMKIFKVISLPWLFVTLPLWGIVMITIIVSIVAIRVFDIKSKFNSNKRYATKDIY